MRTPVTERLSLSQPVIQAPMAGGGDTPKLVAAVSNAGGLGSFGAAYLAPDQIAQYGRDVRALTTRPFGVNLFAPSAAPEIGH
jgi:nitronate monooxygenase